MLDNVPDIQALVASLISFPSPPGWDAFVDLLEKSLDFLARTFNSAGLAVIVFTIIVKTIMLPLTIKATRSSRSMQELQPMIKELQKKRKNDRQKVSQETMKLYSQYGVNPMAGCADSDPDADLLRTLPGDPAPLQQRCRVRHFGILVGRVPLVGQPG